MRRSLKALMLVMVVALTETGLEAQAGLIINISQVGSDVMATGSGTVDLTDLTLVGSNQGTGFVNPSFGAVGEGTPNFNTPTTNYSGISGPTTLGSQGITVANTGTGPAFGVSQLGAQIFVPTGYVSGSSLSSTDTYSGKTISGLGLTPGTYTWTWGTGAHADSLTIQIGTPSVAPEPSTAIGAVFGAVAFVAYGWSRQRREQRRQAAA